MQNHDVYHRLKAAILNLEFRSGDILQEKQIGDRYGASRTPAREALRMLMADGLVSKVGKFYFVKSFTRLEVMELYELREALETLSVRLATRRATDAELFALRDHMTRHIATVVGASAGSSSTDGSVFHMRLAELSGNSMLLEQLRTLHDKMIVLNRMVDTGHREEFVVSLDDHVRIVAAMIRRNEAVAVAEIEAHLRWGAKTALEYLEESLIAPTAIGRNVETQTGALTD